MECGIYDGDNPFFRKLYEYINELNIPFTLNTSKICDCLMKWLNSEIDILDGDENLVEEKICYEKTLSMVLCFYK